MTNATEITDKISERTFAFKAVFYKGTEKLGQTAIMKPDENCAPGWVERGHAKTADEAREIARRWAGY